jgi:hypothetical protein
LSKLSAIQAEDKSKYICISRAFLRPTLTDMIQSDLAEAIYTKLIPLLLMELDSSSVRSEKDRFLLCNLTFVVSLVDEMVYKLCESSG